MKEERPHRIRVLYVIWSLQTGGAERVVADLARSLDPARFAPAVCCLNFKGRLAEELEARGIPVFALDKRPKLDLVVLLKLVRLIKAQRIDIVHTHLWTASLWGRLAAILAAAPVIVTTEHNIDTWRRSYHLAIDRLLARRTDHFIFVSDEVAAFYSEQLGRRLRRFRVVHNGVDVGPGLDGKAVGEVRRRMGIEAGARVAGVVGRLEARKGHRFFVEAMARIAARAPDALGVIVGEGREADALAAQREALGLENTLRLVGYWPDLAEALSALDVFVLPSLMEGHPLAILEAMAMSRPVVATRVGGNGEAVRDGVTGLLVPPADPAALAEAVLSLLEDSPRAAAMGREGRRLFESRFSLEGAVRANEEVYAAAWQSRRRRSANDA